MKHFSTLNLFFFLTISLSLNAQDILWEKSYGGSNEEYLFDAKPTADYGFILAGSSASGKSGSKQQKNIKDLDYWVWKMDEHGDLDWQKQFGGLGNDWLKSIKNTRDGGFILAGTSNSMKSGDKLEDVIGEEDFWILKLDAKGGEQWQKTLGGTGNEILKSIYQTKDGGYIIGGSSSSAPSGNKKEKNFGNLDYWVVKLSPDGSVEWEKSFGGKYVDKLESVLPTKDEGFLLGGWSNSNTSGTKNEDSYGEGDYWLIKLDKNGNEQWQLTLGGQKDDHLSVLISAKEGGYIVGGNSNSGATGTKKKANGKGSDFWILKLSEDGSIDWQQTYDFGKMDILSSITENEDGTLLIGGHAKSESTGLKRSDKKGINDYIALKVTADGERKWKQVIGSSGEDMLRTLIETRDGGYLLTGTSNGAVSRDKNTGNGKRDFWVVKLRDKEKEEAKRYNGLEAFPNPTENFTNVIVNHEFETGTVSIYDISGKRIQFFPATSRTLPIDLRGASVGVYIVTVETNVSTESVKILKSN